ncbi:MAG: family 20 glycosylhydrolase [Lentisphaeria bacterium]|nr:family 20 glycosylhydrolase [Lentisphaeria bacterium]
MLQIPSFPASAGTFPVPSPASSIRGLEGLSLELLQNALNEFRTPESTPCEIAFTLDEAICKDAYKLDLSPAAIHVSACDKDGLRFGLQTLLRLCEVRSLPIGTAAMQAKAHCRGIKVYLPEPVPRFIDEWKHMIDIAARYHINTIMIELGGALEYKSHPEINEGWLEYSAFMNEYPGKTNEIRHQFNFEKNSIHTANGRGKVLTQKQMKDLIDYCRERGMELIPEMPTLSHCDYLLTRHPELAERTDDPYPDTCCPAKDGYYKLIFDLFDEVIALFQPRIINIGHDEYYSIGLCPECRKKSAPQIFADDITRIADYLRNKGVKTMIWGEKLLDSHFLDGVAIGGSDRNLPSGQHIPATFPAIDLVPKDLEILHWYWSIDRTFEQEYIRHGFPFTFGNFAPEIMPDFNKRMARSCGYIISNWGDADFRTFQRNNILFQMAYAFALTWSQELDSEDHRLAADWSKRDLYQLRHLREPEDVITIIHNTTADLPHQHFVDGNYIDERRFLIGHHIVKDEVGTEYALPVIYGSNIGSMKSHGKRIDDPDYICDCYQIDARFWETTCETLPTVTDEIAWYQCTYLNHAPGKVLTYAGFRKDGVIGGDVNVKLFRHGEKEQTLWSPTAEKEYKNGE